MAGRKFFFLLRDGGCASFSFWHIKRLPSQLRRSFILFYSVLLVEVLSGDLSRRLEIKLNTLSLHTVLVIVSIRVNDI